MQTTLKDSLERARTVGEEMRAKLNGLQANVRAELRDPLGLWSPKGGMGLDLDLHVSLAFTACEYAPGLELALEDSWPRACSIYFPIR